MQMIKPSPETLIDLPNSSLLLAYDFISHPRCFHVSPSRANILTRPNLLNEDCFIAVESMTFFSVFNAGMLSSTTLPS